VTGTQSRGIWVQKSTKVLIHHDYFIGVNYNAVISYGNVNFYNNTVFGTKGAGAFPNAGFWQAGDGGSNGVANLKNNIFYDCELGAGRGGDCFMYTSYNLYYLNTADTLDVTMDDNNNVFADPLFVSATPGVEDLRLGIGSPALNTGVNVGLPFDGAAPEIGAYEGSGVTGVSDKQQLPKSLALAQNYPNPFNPSTTISYDLPRAVHVTLKVYNTLGQEVATLVNENTSAGVHVVQFNGSALASGVYLYRLQTPGFLQSKKMLLMK
jgi:hypothetical protein